MLTCLALGFAAFAGDVTDAAHIHVTERVAAGGWPTGAITVTQVEARTPLRRTGGLVFNDTFAGFGARVAITPAFTEAGVQLTIAPVDVFDMGVRVSYVNYYGVGTGLLPFDGLTGTLETSRNPRKEDARTGSALWAVLTPTLKAKVGPVIAVSGWEIAYTDMSATRGDATSPYVYEPFRDLVLGWRDLSFEHQALVLFEALNGDHKPLLRLGPSVRHRYAATSRDESVAVGATFMVDPAPDRRAAPDIGAQVLWYAKDNDRMSPIPSMGVALTWTVDVATRPHAIVEAP